MSSEELTASEPMTAGAAEAGEAPKKRTVRRTRKPATADTPAAENAGAAPQKEPQQVSGAASEAEAKPAPKRRTRRTTAASADDAPASEAEKPATASAASAEAGEAPKKRTVRRTRKSASEEASVGAADAAPQKEPQQVSGTASEAETKPAPKRRTRRTAAASDAEGASSTTASAFAVAPSAAASAATPAEASSETAGGEGVSTQERPRRRTRRTVTVNTEPAASSEGTAQGSSEKPARRAEGASQDAAAHTGEAAHAGEGTRTGEGSHNGEGTHVTVRRQRVHLGRPSSEGGSNASNEGQASGSQQDKPRPGRGTRDQQQRNRQQNSNHNNAKNNGNRQQNGNHGANQQQNNRHQRRNQHERTLVAPKTTLEDVSAMKVAELRARADELGIEHDGLKKQDLIGLVYEASVRAEGFIEVEGILDILQDGYGFLRTDGYLPGENDVYVSAALIRRNNLRKGDLIKGQTRPARDNDKYAALQQIHLVNGGPVEEASRRPRFGDLTPIFPDEVLKMEHGHSTITARVIDLVSPIGKGQRGLIVSPPKAGKTTVLKDIAAAITANNPEVHLMCLLVDERPEEVTDMQRSIKGEVIASTFDMPTENHITVSELVIERAKRLVEQGEDVVILLDSLTRLARAYNLAQPASGRILSGGVDSMALYPPKRFLGAARNIEGGGSLTILASALIETGSKMDEVIFEEFKGTGNMELKLDRNLADRRIFPAIDPVASGTRREDLLLDPQEAPLIWAVRRVLANMNNTERAMDMLIKSLRQTENNREFLIRAAKKAQSSRNAEIFEL